MNSSVKIRDEVDPITLELIRCRLEAGAQQMAAVLWKSAFSTSIREVLDYSTALFDAHGQMVAQSAQLPFQMMTMSAPMRHLIRSAYRWQEDDVVLLNDPYACDGQHLPDFMTFRPIFIHGRLIGFAGAIAHMIDVGGAAPGGYFASATEIYQEGIRIPPIKYINRGVRNEELVELLSLNIREADKVLGDLSAMAAATNLGAVAMNELTERYGIEQVQQGMAAILNASELQVRKRLAAIPCQTCSAVDYVDDDGITQEPVRISVELRFNGDHVEADFGGSSPQASGPINATLDMTTTTFIYVLMATIGQGIAKNDGWRRAVTVTAPPRTVVNASSPAPIASRVTTCHRVVDTVMQALASVIPDRVVAGYYGNSNICNIGGFNSETGKSWVHFEIEVGGWGGRPTCDGLDGFSAHIHNLANTPIEVVEAEKPLRVERYEFIDGSGGEGEYRGGLGLRRDIRLLAENASLNLLGDRCRFAPKGLFGGKDGRTGRYVLNPQTPYEKLLPNKLSNYTMRKGDVISMQTAGGAGYGDVQKRNPASIIRDRIEGKSRDHSKPPEI